jgi:hypothetical protein
LADFISRSAPEKEQANFLKARIKSQPDKFFERAYQSFLSVDGEAIEGAPDQRAGSDFQMFFFGDDKPAEKNFTKKKTSAEFSPKEKTHLYPLPLGNISITLTVFSSTL